MVLLKWIIIVAAIINFGFMTLDGSRAIIKGDYIKPQKGKYSGQLGPWSRIVSAIGIDPESSLMKWIFIVWGLLGVMITICFSLNIDWALRGMLLMNIFSIWYLVPGTILSVLQIILLTIIMYFH